MTKDISRIGFKNLIHYRFITSHFYKEMVEDYKHLSDTAFFKEILIISPKINTVPEINLIYGIWNKYYNDKIIAKIPELVVLISFKGKFLLSKGNDYKIIADKIGDNLPRFRLELEDDKLKASKNYHNYIVENNYIVTKLNRLIKTRKKLDKLPNYIKYDFEIVGRYEKVVGEYLKYLILIMNDNDGLIFKLNSYFSLKKDRPPLDLIFYDILLPMVDALNSFVK